MFRQRRNMINAAVERIEGFQVRRIYRLSIYQIIVVQSLLSNRSCLARYALYETYLRYYARHFSCISLR